MIHDEIEQMCRKDREREQHRREILKAAERIFALKGYHETTMEEVAREAEFAVGTLYNMFKGKDDLYARVIEAFVQEFMRQFQEKVLSVDDAEEAIAALIELRLTHFHEHQEFIRLVFQASLSNRVDLVWAISPDLIEIHSRYTEAVRAIFQRGITRQTFDEADPLYLALCLEGIINAFVAYWSRHKPTESLSVRVTKMKREFVGRIKVRLEDGLQPSAGATPCSEWTI